MTKIVNLWDPTQLKMYIYIYGESICYTLLPCSLIIVLVDWWWSVKTKTCSSSWEKTHGCVARNIKALLLNASVMLAVGGKIFAPWSTHLFLLIAVFRQQCSFVSAWIESDILLHTVCVWCNSISNMSLMENVAENFGAILQENLFQVNRVYTKWPISWKQQDRC